MKRRGRSLPVDTLARRMWRDAVVRGQRCVMCGAFPVDQDTRRAFGPELRRKQAHHIIEKGLLRREGYHDRLWDRRNGICLCEYHHGRHTSRIQPVPRDLLPWPAFEFACELGLTHVLERAYPDGPVERFVPIPSWRR